jgi:hypothetical protein
MKWSRYGNGIVVVDSGQHVVTCIGTRLGILTKLSMD